MRTVGRTKSLCNKTDKKAEEYNVHRNFEMLMYDFGNRRPQAVCLEIWKVSRANVCILR